MTGLFLYESTKDVWQPSASFLITGMCNVFSDACHMRHGSSSGRLHY